MSISLTASKAVVTRVAGRAGLQLSKHLPEILTVVGIGGGIATVITAAKATLELEANTASGRKVLKDHRQLREERSEEEYPKAQYARDLMIGYVRVAKGVAKTYAIPFALGSASVTSILGAVGILKSRNAALSAAYNLLDASYNAYKKRVVEEVGPEKEAEIAGNFRAPESVTDEDREKLSEEDLEKLTKRLEKNAAAGKPSPYAVWFDRKNEGWGINPEHTMFWLESQQNYMNDLLRTRGHLFTNDVYRALGMPDTQIGAVTGWIYNNEDGDQFVDFNLDKIEKHLDSPFGSALANGFWIELNVDGVIYDKLGKK